MDQAAAWCNNMGNRSSRHAGGGGLGGAGELNLFEVERNRRAAMDFLNTDAGVQWIANLLAVSAP